MKSFLGYILLAYVSTILGIYLFPSILLRGQRKFSASELRNGHPQLQELLILYRRLKLAFIFACGVISCLLLIYVLNSSAAPLIVIMDFFLVLPVFDALFAITTNVYQVGVGRGNMSFRFVYEKEGRGNYIRVAKWQLGLVLGTLSVSGVVLYLLNSYG